MNIALHLQLWKRYLGKIIVITFLVALSVTFFGIKKAGPSVQTTLFINIAAQHEAGNPDGSAYEAVEAADHFTEAVQGWMLNPGLIQRINENSGETVNISARKQEKQNLILTFSSLNTESAEKIAGAVQEELTKDITAYNQAAQSAFNIAVFDSRHEESSVRQIFFPILGIILGLFLGILLAYLFEILNNLAMFPSQIEEVTQKKTRAVSKKNSGAYMEALAQKEGLKDVTLVQVGKNLSAEKVTKALKEVGEVTMASWPGSTEKNNAIENKTTTILLTELGKTPLNNLEEAVTLMPEDFVLVTLL